MQHDLSRRCHAAWHVEQCLFPVKITNLSCLAQCAQIWPEIDDIVEVTRQMLAYDPTERITARAALRHPFFSKAASNSSGSKVSAGAALTSASGAAGEAVHADHAPSQTPA